MGTADLMGVDAGIDALEMGTTETTPISLTGAAATVTTTTVVRAALIGCVCAVVCALGADCAVADSGGEAVTYQLDPAHDGYQPDPGFTVPLQQQWSIKEPYYMGNYPLIANGVIYIVVGQNLEAIVYQRSIAAGASHG